MIRQLKEDDIYKIIELENKTLNTSLGVNILNEALKNEMSYFFVFEENENIIGYISTMFDGNIVEILNFCVEPSYQNKGYGTNLLIYIDNYFYQLNAKSMILEVDSDNLKAINLYKKFGFELINIRKKYYKNGHDALVLNHNLITCADIYDLYVLQDVKKESFDSYIKYYDDIQKDKYYNNYFKILNPKKEIIDIIKQKQFRPYLMIFSEYEIDKLLDYKYEKESLIYMHSSIYGLNPLKNNNHIVNKLNEKDSNLLFEFIYNDCLEFGEEFALGNANRFKDNFLNNKLDYFGIYNDNKLVANLFVFKYKDSIFIENVLVKENYRHKGYCSSLFSYIIDYYKKIGIKEVILVADLNDTVKYMYLDMGFTICQKFYTYLK